MRKVLMIMFCLVVCLVSIGAERGEPHYETVDLSQMQLMSTTAYCCGTHTANGSKVHIGGCACNPHFGDVAIVYSTSGRYLGMYECNDKGGTDGLRAGTVIDIYRPTYTMCESWMKLTGGKVYVLWVEGKG